MTQVFVYELTTQMETQVPIPSSGEGSLFTYLPSFQWMTDESALYIPLFDQLWQYDPVTQEAARVIEPHRRSMGYLMAYDLSPDNSVLAVSDSTQGVSVIAQFDGHVESYIPPPSKSTHQEPTSIEWDSSGQWLMIDWDAPEQPSLTTFVHRSGFPRHELIQDQWERGSDWLPPQVAFDGSWGTRILTSGAPDKEFLMVPPDSTWPSNHLNVSAWSPTSERLATLYDHNLVIWNTTTWTQERIWDFYERPIPDLVSDGQYLNWLDERYLWIGSRQFGLFDTQTGQVDEAVRVGTSAQSGLGAWCVRECTEFLLLDMVSDQYGEPTLTTKDLLQWQHEQQLIERLGPIDYPTYSYGLSSYDDQTFTGTIDNADEETSQVFLWEFGSDGRINETDLGLYDMFGPEDDRSNPNLRRYAGAQISPSGHYITLSYGTRSGSDPSAGTSTRLYDRQTKTWTQLADTSKSLRISPQDTYMFYFVSGFFPDMGELTLFNEKEVIADGLDAFSVLYWSPDETRMVIHNQHSGLSFLRLDTQSNILTEETSYSLYFCGNNIASPIALSPDQRYLALNNCQTELAVFDLKTFEIVRRVNRVPRLMVWSPDSSWLALDTFQILSLVQMPQP